jgi:hypothetical protein
MAKQHTDTKLLLKGIKMLALSIPMIVASTYLLTFVFLNKEVLPMYLLFPLALIFMVLTIYLIFKGIKTLIKAVF